MSPTFTSLFIDGRWTYASTAASFEVRNPCSREIVSCAAAASKEDCHRAVEAAQCAFATWQTSPLSKRRDIFLKAADLLSTEKYREKLKAAVQGELALTRPMVELDIVSTVESLRTYAAFIVDLKGQSFASSVPGGHVVAQRKPIGVVLSIASWNIPLGLSVRAVAVPIVCGNTVILRSSEACPGVHAIVGELLHEAGLPGGVLNIVSVAAKDVGERTAEIIAHRAVRKINFTGSDRVGKIIAMESARYLKPCVLELGGKAPVVVLEDADIERAAQAIASSSLLNSGQICMSTERVVVQRPVAHALISSLITHFRRVKAGVAREALSSLFSEAAAQSVLEMIQDAHEEGARVLVGDMRRDGAVVQPHLLSDVKPGMRIWDRESFGPVAVIAEVDTIEKAVDLANTSDYSLVASLWTQNVHVAFDVAGRLNYGNVNVNGQTVQADGDMGGLGGASGYGRFNVENFTNLRYITFHPQTAEFLPLCA